MSAIFYFLSWKLYKPLPKTLSLLENQSLCGDQGDIKSEQGSVTVSNVTEGTVIEDNDNNSFLSKQGHAATAPMLVYESAI